MTLIKSTDGSGWVEARVNDTVDCMGDEVTLTQQHIEDGYISAHKSDPWCSVDLSDCQLIERPMQVDDPIEVMEAGVWVNNRDVYSGSEYAKKCYGAGLTRHSSPLLRPVGGV